jgi:prepilin-type N-terminal cleavage/methylation domain-containing protein
MKKMIKKRGFTLVEMLLAIAILVVLSGAILVSISSQREKARVTRMLSEVSAVVPAIYMCVADGGSVQIPSSSGGNEVCQIDGVLESGYGEWPAVIDGFSQYNASDSDDFNDDNWYLELLDDNSISRICCNTNMAGCKILDSGETCDVNTL